VIFLLNRQIVMAKRGAVRAKKTNIDGIEFASSLEAYCYKKLKAAGIDFGYESRTFEVLPSTRYNATYLKSVPKHKKMRDYTSKIVRGITYTPDFVSDSHKFIIETKGFVPSNHSFPLRWKLFIHHLQAQGMGDYKLFIPRNQEQVNDVIQEIKDADKNE
tara:strand:- start:1279 stop:1758 length:480 start_codon:yes stop_codon:yes gene_type:complete